MDILQANRLYKNFGGLTAVNSISFSIAAGERHAIIGPNGAGKTTLFNLLSGELSPSRGAVFFAGQDITALPPHRRAQLGMARTFQRNNLFFGLSVWENARLAAHGYKGVGPRAFGSAQLAHAPLVESCLERVGLSDRRTALARNLSYGEQRQLEVAIALATQPQVLLLDEPAAGMSPAETTRLMQILQEMPREMTLLIIEHDMDVVFTLAERVTVLHYGQVIAEGKTEQVRTDPRVLEVYLGVAKDAHARTVGDGNSG